jgi:hypothetical protein
MTRRVRPRKNVRPRKTVMAGLDPATSTGAVAESDGRVKPGHDGW